MNMTVSEAMRYIQDDRWNRVQPGLSRTQQLLELMGNPQEKLKFIHVAGSNGKGSTCAMFASVLQSAGYRCGLYTSPYVEDFCEQIRINGENIPGERLAQVTSKAMSCAETMEDHPSQFELLTAIALTFFYEEGCDIVVLEVGMGGELDATNVIGAPELACITNIGLEHTEYLGSTLEEIARSKAGIIKPGSRCVCYDGDPAVTAVIRAACMEQGVAFTLTDFSRLELISAVSGSGQPSADPETGWFPETEKQCQPSAAPEERRFPEESLQEKTKHHIPSRNLHIQHFLWKESEGSCTEYTIPLQGTYQLHNAALTLTGLEILWDNGWNISREAVQQGFSQLRWPARMEVLATDPVVILDGGHNPQCAEALAESLDAMIPGQKVVFLSGVLKDKNYEEIIDRLLPYAREFICVTPQSSRALSAETLAELICSRNIPNESCEDVEQALALALEHTGRDGVLVIFGSLYLAGPVRKAFPSVYRKFLRKASIAARKKMDPKERRRSSDLISKRILESEEYKMANTIFVYRAIRGEVSLRELVEQAVADGKTVAFPRCMDKEHIEAFIPEGEESLIPGPFGILEPAPDPSRQVDPQQVDLVVCPGTAFDLNGNRIGMGAGHYDRYLSRCDHARVIAAAYDVQITGQIPAEPWDRPMEKVFTEKRVIVRH